MTLKPGDEVSVNITTGPQPRGRILDIWADGTTLDVEIDDIAIYGIRQWQSGQPSDNTWKPVAQADEENEQMELVRLAYATMFGGTL